MARSYLLIFAGIGALIFPVLVAIAIYASVLSGRQSLPTPLLGHILSLALPTFTVIGLLLPRILPSVVVVKRPFVTRQQLQASLLGLLGLLDSSLITLAATLLQPEFQSCSLDRQWQLLFTGRNVHAIKAIQDTLNCCGFKTTLDRPWPWPDHRSSGTCREDFGRDRSCRAGWAGREVRVLTVWIVVGVGGLIIKAVFVMATRNQPAHSQDDRATGGRRHYSHGRVTDRENESATGGRYIDQANEETPLRTADAEGESRRVAA